MDSTYFPTIISFTPTLATTGVTTTPSLVARFNLDLDSDQINNHLNDHVLLVPETGGATIPLVLSSYNNFTLSLTPSGALTPNETYQITFLRTIKSSTGRSMTNNRSFVFLVDSYDIEQVTLLEPADSTAVAVPSFSWEVVTAGEAVEYTLELDVNTSFTTVATKGWTTTTSGTAVELGVELPLRAPYFWRVRAESVTGSTVGPWSDARSFFYGSFLTSTVDTRQVYTTTEVAQLLYDPLPDPPSHLATWPDLTFQFSKDLATGSVTASTVTFTSRSVDGFPTALESPVAHTLTVTHDTITITPELAKPLENTRYTVNFLRGITDIDGRALTPASYTLTATYRPHYVGIDVIHSGFGSLLVDLPDDVIHFHIFRNSLEVNRYFLYYDQRFAGGPTQQTVRNFIMPVALATYPMEKWVEYETVGQLLTLKMRDVLQNAGKMQRLADYTEQTSAEIIKAYRTAIDDAFREARARKAEWARHWAKPESALYGNFGGAIYDTVMTGHRRGL